MEDWQIRAQKEYPRGVLSFQRGNFEFARDVWKTCLLVDRSSHDCLYGLACLESRAFKHDCQPNAEKVSRTATRTMVVHDNTDMPGDDFANFAPATQAECGKRCESDPRCKAFTFVHDMPWLPRQHNRCWLKDQVPLGRRESACCASGTIIEPASR